MLFRYPGGKDKIAKLIVKDVLKIYGVHPFKRYHEPFFGSGAVCFRLLASGVHIPRIWINDFDPGIYSIWWAVINKPEEFMELIRAFKPTPEEFYQFKDDILSGKRMPHLDVAMRKLAIHQMSYSGLGSKAGGPIGGKTQKGDYKIDCRWSPRTLAANIEKANRLFETTHVTLTMEDYAKLLAAGNDTLVYLDPPYFEKGEQLYQYAFTEDKHRELAETLSRAEFLWVLSYDDHPEIRKLYASQCIIEVPISYTIHGAAKKNELLIVDKRFENLVKPNNKDAEHGSSKSHNGKELVQSHL